MSILRAKGTLDFLAAGVFYAILAESFFIALSPLVAEIALVVGILLYGLRLWLDKTVHFCRLPFDWPVLIFALCGAASIAVSPNPAFSFYNYYNLAGVYLLTYILVGQNVTRPEQVRWIAVSLAAAAAIVVLYGYYQYIFGIDTSAMKWVDGDAFPELKKRVFSTWENPNILAGYLDAAICLVFGVFLQAREKRQQLLLGGGMLLLAGCLAMTYARGACLTIAVVLAGYGVLKNRRILLAVIVLGAALLALDTALAERLLSVFTKMDTSSEMRLAFWESTLAMIMDHPLLGIGWGAYWMVYPEYDFYINDAAIRIVHAHNIYLNYAAEIGIAGAIAYFTWFFGTMGMALRSKDYRSSVLLNGLLLGIGLAMVSVALNGITDDVLFNIPSSMLLWFLGALAVVIEKKM